MGGASVAENAGYGHDHRGDQDDEPKDDDDGALRAFTLLPLLNALARELSTL
jgi:hypothetical protein